MTRKIDRCCPDDVTIRSATVEDAAGIGSIQVLTWRDAYRGLISEETLSGMTGREIALYVTEIVQGEHDGEFALVTESCGRLATFCIGGPERSCESPNDGHSGEIYSMYVLPEFQGMGIGRKLSASGRATLASYGRAELALWVLEGNERTIGFLRKSRRDCGRKEEFRRFRKRCDRSRNALGESSGDYSIETSSPQ